MAAKPLLQCLYSDAEPPLKIMALAPTYHQEKLNIFLFAKSFLIFKRFKSLTFNKNGLGKPKRGICTELPNYN